MATGLLAPPAGYSASQLIFEDGFDSATLDTSKWNPWLGEDQYGRWSDQSLLPSPYSGMNMNGSTFQTMYYDPYPYGGGSDTTGDHLTGGGGTLSMTATPSSYFGGLGYSWGSAAVSSYGKAYLPASGGYVQWQAKMPDSSHGAWGGIWLLSPGGAEFDVQESGYLHGSSNPNNVLASNWHGSGGNQVIQDTGTDLSAGYHTYGVEYRPGQSWTVFLDGKEMAQWTSGVPTNAAYELVMDLEMAGPQAAGWHTVADPTNDPGPYQFDFSDVQVYSLSSSPVASYTPTPTPTSGTDTTPPTVPTGLAAVGVSPHEVDLAWSPSSDPDSSVYGYDVYRDGNYLGFTPNPNYQDGTVSPQGSYNYQVLAYDPSRNVSALSAPLGVSTSGSSTPVSTTTSVSSGPVDTTTMSSADLLAALGFH
ncbi:MAG TPA: glycoside hydrolase family 16 protein [Stellaceae bacterium]|nr:glycoside hydrolase family 16 protein [Stellaceae bacterium]